MSERAGGSGEEPRAPRAAPRTSRWQELAGDESGRDYARRFDALAASGADVHGEATFVASLLKQGAPGAPGARNDDPDVRRRLRILDAGCGTGRVAVRLAELGYTCVGVDVDESMLEVAREADPRIPWFRADLTTLDAEAVGGAGLFDLVVMAGNVVPLLPEGTCQEAVTSLARLLRPGGLLVAGFGLDPAHLPRGCPITTLEEYDAACQTASLRLVDRFSTWSGDAYAPGAPWAVSVHRTVSAGD